MNVQKEYNIDPNAEFWTGVSDSVEFCFSSFCDTCEFVWNAHLHGREYKVTNHY